jgi:hypothetical protein
MKKLIYLMMVIAILGLIVSGCSIPLKSVVPTSEKGNPKPELGAPVIERGVFVDHGYSSPPWYPPEEETDRYKWGPKYFWVDPSVEVLVNPTLSGFSSEELDAVVGEVEKGLATWSEVPNQLYSATVTRNDTVGPGLDIENPVNTVSWGEIDGLGGIIAITYFWYYVNTKELIDTDIIFDADELWSISAEVPSDKFDVWNIATHEAGHTLVLGDLRSPKDGALTMHAYTWLGDTVKRTLGSGDILGVRAIYGE